MTRDLEIVYSASGTSPIVMFSESSLSNPFQLHEWLPAGLINYKDGGIFRDSKSAAGRKPIYKQRANIVETLTISVHGSSQNAVATLIRRLQRAAHESFDYWLSNSSIALPVYLKTRAGDETAYRYAPIYKMEISGLSDPYTGSFEGGLLLNGTAYASGFAQITLTIERDDWRNNVPGSYTEVVASTQVINREGSQGGNSVIYVLTHDSSLNSYSSNLWPLGGDTLLFPNPSGPNDMLLIGSGSPFSFVTINITVPGNAALVEVWYTDSVENPGGFTEPPAGAIVDNTAGLTVAGTVTISVADLPNWTTATFNSITAYWIGFLMVGSAWTVDIPQADSILNQIFGTTITMTEIGGDLDALARLELDGTTASDSGRVIAGFKETQTNFRPFVNLVVGGTNPIGMTNTNMDSTITSSLGVTGLSPNGAVVIAATGSTGGFLYTNRLIFNPAVADDYKGRYRWFLRARVLDSGDTFNVKVNVLISSVTILTKTVTFTNSGGFSQMYADLGYLSLSSNNPNLSSDTVTFQFLVSTAAAGTLHLYDLVFIPADIMIFDAKSTTGVVDDGLTLLVDSCSSPKNDILAGIYNTSSGAWRNTISVACTNGKFTLPPNKALTLAIAMFDSDGNIGTFTFGFVGNVTLSVSTQYGFVRDDG